MSDYRWSDDATCKSVGTDLFYPAIGDHWSTRQAKQICASCPVIADCWREHKTETHGIFAGLTPPQRRQLVNSGIEPAFTERTAV